MSSGVNSLRPQIAVIGGGSGLATLLRGLKHYPAKLAGVVTMTDNGQSSGRLSREMGVLPPGDVRSCLTALSKDEALLTKLFQYRFHKGRGLSGHSLGNLLLIALADITGDFESAVQASSKILSIKGEVIPSTLDHVNIIATLKNGQQALGEVDTAIQGHRFGIKKIELLPEAAAANPSALKVINEADLIIVGPGSFFTSLVPNFLIKELREAVENSSAKKIYICNSSTERGETENFTVEDHILRLKEYTGDVRFDAVLVNSNVVARTGSEGKLGSVRNITTTQKEIDGIPAIIEDLIDEQRPLLHDSNKLASVIWQYYLAQVKASTHQLVQS